MLLRFRRIRNKGGALGQKSLWLLVGVLLFIVVGFILPVPHSLIETLEDYGFVEKFSEWGLADDVNDVADKSMIVLAMVAMAVVFFATEAVPVGVTGILMPIFAYFFNLLPFGMIGKTFSGDAPLFMLGVFALGVSVVHVGFHKRLAVWLLGWTRGFVLPLFVLCLSMSVVGSFLSAPAMCSFMVPVLVAVYMGVVSRNAVNGQIEHDPALAKLLLFCLCFSLNVGGVGTPAAGGRNVIMMGFFHDYNVHITFFEWMTYGWPLVPVGGCLVFLYMMLLFARKVKDKDLTPGLRAIRRDVEEQGGLGYKELVTIGMLLLILFLWILKGEALGLGGPALLALVIPVIFRTTEWKTILKGISWDAWFMYCGALTLGVLLRESGGALWLAKSFLNILANVSMAEGYPLWVGMSAFSGLITNFMSDASTVALIGPIVIPMGVMTGNAAEPWAIGLAVAFASSYAHFLVVGSPTNALVYGLGVYPDKHTRIIRPVDFIKYGFLLWVLCMMMLWVVELLLVYHVNGFPPDILDAAQGAGLK